MRRLLASESGRPRRVDSASGSMATESALVAAIRGVKHVYICRPRSLIPCKYFLAAYTRSSLIFTVEAQVDVKRDRHAVPRMLQMRLLVGLLILAGLSTAARADFVYCYAVGTADQRLYASGVFESDNIATTAKAFALYLERNGVKAGSALCPAAKNKEDAQRDRDDLIRGRKVVSVPFLD